MWLTRQLSFLAASLSLPEMATGDAPDERPETEFGGRVGNVELCRVERAAFCSLTRSAGARRYYVLRARGKNHHQALRQLANRWVGILHGCLDYGCLYEEDVPWRTAQRPAT